MGGLGGLDQRRHGRLGAVVLTDPLVEAHEVRIGAAARDLRDTRRAAQGRADVRAAGLQAHTHASTPQELDERGVGGELTVDEHHDPITDGLDLLEDVGREDDRRVLGEPLDEGADLENLDRIEAVRGLVEDEDLGLVQDRLGEPDTLTVALGELRDRPDQVLAQARGEHGLLHRGDPLFDGDAPELRHHEQILLDEHFRVERRVLRQVANLALNGQTVDLDVYAADGHRARRGLEVAGQDLHHRGLAGAVLPEQTHDVAPSDLEVEVLHGPESTVPLFQFLY